MGEMHKTSKEYCAKCKYCYASGAFNFLCDRYLILGEGNRRNCPVGMCDKFEPRKKKYIAQNICYGKGKKYDR